MPKKTSKAKASTKQVKTNQKSQRKSALSSLKRLPKYLKIFCGFFAFAVPMCFYLYPKVIIQSDPKAIRGDPFQSIFLITNQSALSIADVHYIFIPSTKTITGNVFENNFSPGFPDVFRQNPIIQRILPGKSAALNRNYMIMQAPVHWASIRISYSYNYLGLTFNDTSAFYCVRGIDNWYQWVPL